MAANPVATSRYATAVTISQFEVARPRQAVVTVGRWADEFLMALSASIHGQWICCGAITRPATHQFHSELRGAVSAMHSTKFSAASMSIFSASVLMPRRSLSLNFPKT